MAKKMDHRKEFKTDYDYQAHWFLQNWSAAKVEAYLFGEVYCEACGEDLLNRQEASRYNFSSRRNDKEPCYQVVEHYPGPKKYKGEMLCSDCCRIEAQLNYAKQDRPFKRTFKSPIPFFLLEDEQGVYGIRLKGHHDYVLRPDKVKTMNYKAYSYRPHLLHTLPNAGIKDTVEGEIHKALLEHEEKVNGASIYRWNKFVSKGRAEKRHNEAKTFAGRMANWMIKKVVASADKKVLKAVRKFHWSLRGALYWAGVTQGERALQLMQTFPLLAVYVYCKGYAPVSREAVQVPGIVTDNVFSGYHDYIKIEEAYFQEGMCLVQMGAPLKEIANFLDVPMATRKLKPGAVHMYKPKMAEHVKRLPGLKAHRDYLATLPKELRWRQPLTRWQMLCMAVFIWDKRNQYEHNVGHRAKPENIPSLSNFGEWAFKHIHQLGINSVIRLESELATFRDYTALVHGCEQLYGVRGFNHLMSPQAVRRNMQLWHERQQVEQDRRYLRTPEDKEKLQKYLDDQELPLTDPWLNQAQIDQIMLVPVNSYHDLKLEGQEMHHCVGGYWMRVAKEECQIYSVRKGSSRLATVEIRKVNSMTTTGMAFDVYQIQGPRNQDPGRQVHDLVHDWVKQETREYNKVHYQVHNPVNQTANLSQDCADQGYQMAI
jgi:hypothetical protein